MRDIGEGGYQVCFPRAVVRVGTTAHDAPAPGRLDVPKDAVGYRPVPEVA